MADSNAGLPPRLAEFMRNLEAMPPAPEYRPRVAPYAAPAPSRQPNWQDLSAFGAGQPLLPFALPPPRDQPPQQNWQDLAAWAQPPQQPPAPLQSVTDLRNQPLSDTLQPTEAEQADLQRQGREMVNLGTNVAPFALAGPTGVAMRGVAAAARAFPRVATAAAGAGALTAAPGQANEPDPLSTARDTIARLRASQADLQTERTRLGAERLQFDKINSSDKAAVAEAQRRLGLKPDGNWGPDTSKAIAAHKANVEGQITALDRQGSRLAQDLETQQGRLTGLEGQERLRLAEQDVGPFSRALRDYGELGGTAAGLVLGPAGRLGMVRHANRAAAESAAAVEASLARRMSAVPQRTGRLNEVWRQGGSEPGGVPFVPTPATKYGVGTNPSTTPSSELFPGRPGITGQFNATDASITGALGAEGAGAEYRRVLADREIAEAQAAAQKDPSQLNIQRLQRAIDERAFWQSLARVGQAGATSYAATATKTPRVYPRPDLSQADAEMANLNRLINPPKPARKRKK